jgi:ferredoxin
VDGLWRSDETGKRVYSDEDECVGCGTGEEICPEVFRLDAQREKTDVIKPEAGPGNLIQEAVESRPVPCIHWKS